MFIEQIIGSKSKVKILRVLTEVRKAYNLQALHKEANISTGIVSASLKELVNAGILTKMKGKRKERLFTFNTLSPYATILLQLFATEKIQYRKNVVLLNVWNILERTLCALKNKIELMILFGSNSRGESTVESDIDIFIVHKTGISITIIKNELNKLDKRISPLIMSKEEFFSNIKEQTPLYLNIKKEGIIIFMNDMLHTTKEMEHFVEGFKPEVLQFGGTIDGQRI